MASKCLSVWKSFWTIESRSKVNPLERVGRMPSTSEDLKHDCWTKLADMYDGSSFRVGDSPAQYFVRDRGSISLSQEDESKHVRDRISFLPLKICVRNSSRLLLNIDQESRY